MDLNRLLHNHQRALIDGATRAPALPQLARDFRNDPARPSPAARAAGPLGRAVRFYPAPPGAGPM